MDIKESKFNKVKKPIYLEDLKTGDLFTSKHIGDNIFLVLDAKSFVDTPFRPIYQSSKIANGGNKIPCIALNSSTLFIFHGNMIVKKLKANLYWREV